jgi:hypothetical protein
MTNKKIGLATLIVVIAASATWAGDFSGQYSFTSGDVMLCFRKNGGANDLVVDVGSVTNYINLAANQRYVITNYTGVQLGYVGTNAASWSAFTYLDDNTIFMSKARSSLNTQTSPWVAQTAAAQGLLYNNISTIPPGAYDNRNYKPQNTIRAVVEVDSSEANLSSYPDGQSYHSTIDPGSAGDFTFGGTFAGNPEITTAANFTTAGAVVRSDFYQIPPSDSGGAVQFLGYFEFSTNGVMTYVAYPSSGTITAPTIISITRTGTTNTITFTTGPTGTYTLLGTNILTAPKATWPPISSVAGNNAQQSLTDVNTNGTGFYMISAQ